MCFTEPLVFFLKYNNKYDNRSSYEDNRYCVSGRDAMISHYQFYAFVYKSNNTMWALDYWVVLLGNSKLYHPQKIIMVEIHIPEFWLLPHGWHPGDKRIPSHRGHAERCHSEKRFFDPPSPHVTLCHLLVRSPPSHATHQKTLKVKINYPNILYLCPSGDKLWSECIDKTRKCQRTHEESLM